MKIKFDENGHVIGYVEIGDMEGSIEFTGELPTDFKTNSKFYRVDNGVLVFDADKQNVASQKEIDEQRRIELDLWFKWYDVQVAQYKRAQRAESLGLPSSNIFSGDIQALDNEANLNQVELATLNVRLGYVN